VAAFVVFEVNPSQPPLKKGRSKDRPSLVSNLPLLKEGELRQTEYSFHFPF
jgi:hypothetical protein